MDVRDLLDIKAICDAGSYRKAAETLGVTQPTLMTRADTRRVTGPGQTDDAHGC